jgi:hypothetical protein
MSAEAAAENPAQQGEPPPEREWATWLYSGGHVTVCDHSQVIAAILTSMDTCVGEKEKDDCWPARALQRRLLEVLQENCSNALYPNAACTLAELQQDVALDQARVAMKSGGDVAAALRTLRKPYLAILRCIEGEESVSCGGYTATVND